MRNLNPSQRKQWKMGTMGSLFSFSLLLHCQPHSASLEGSGAISELPGAKANSGTLSLPPICWIEWVQTPSYTIATILLLLLLKYYPFYSSTAASTMIMTLLLQWLLYLCYHYCCQSSFLLAHLQELYFSVRSVFLVSCLVSLFSHLLSCAV